MGAQVSVATSAVNNIVRAGITAATSFSTQCAGNIVNDQSFRISNCRAKVGTITFRNNGVAINKCVTDVNNKQSLQNAVEQAIHQATEAAKQQLGILNIGQAAANIATSTLSIELELATAITTQFATGCGNDLVSKQQIECDNGSTFEADAINFESSQVSINECALKAAQNTNAYNQLKNIFKQSTVAKEESIFSIYVVVALVTISIISLFMVNRTGASRGSNWSVMTIVIVLSMIIIIYAVLASSRGWWPFLSTEPPSKGYKVQ